MQSSASSTRQSASERVSEPIRMSTSYLLQSGSTCRSPKASRLLLGTALELGTAGGAKVATVMGHARPDTANVRDVLLAEPHRVRFTGRTLLRGPLLRGGGPRRHRECETQQHRSRGFHRPELLLGATNVHYRRPFGFWPGIYCQFNNHGATSPTLIGDRCFG